MKILFDHQIFSYQRYGGASKYFCEILERLPHDSWQSTCVYSNNAYVKEKMLFPIKTIFGTNRVPGQGRIMNYINRPKSIIEIAQGKYDVFHQTHYETYCFPYLKNRPMVTTVHDLNFIMHNGNSYLADIQKKSVERAEKIIAVSNNTKNDIVNTWNVDEQKIDVIYHGVDKKHENLPIDRFFPFPYILYVGTRLKYKNFDRLYNVFKRIHKMHSGIRLVCTYNRFTNEEMRTFNSDGLANKIIHVSASEADMSRLYRDASVYVYPSIYEGFGMPILEAMNYDCPVALSNASCFPEIASYAGSYFDPLDEEDMFTNILKVIEDDNFRISLIDKGKERIKDFSWDKCAEEHMRVYKSLI